MYNKPFMWSCTSYTHHFNTEYTVKALNEMYQFDGIGRILTRTRGRTGSVAKRQRDKLKS